MPLLLDSHDYLPYVDSQLTQPQLDAATAVLQAEIDHGQMTELHPSVPNAYEPKFSALMEAGLSRIASNGSFKMPGEGIDLSRYEEPSAPTNTKDHDEWHNVLRTAYISHEYLAERELNLSLLDRFGKNAWLIGNSQVEQELQSIEQDLAALRTQIEQIEQERRDGQALAGGELQGLEQSWRATVSRAIEAEVAGEELRRRILAKRRGG